MSDDASILYELKTRGGTEYGRLMYGLIFIEIDKHIQNQDMSLANQWKDIWSKIMDAEEEDLKGFFTRVLTKKESTLLHEMLVDAGQWGPQEDDDPETYPCSCKIIKALE